jgi:hypothetical protein
MKYLKTVEEYRMRENGEQEQWRGWTDLSTIYLQEKYHGKIPTEL